MTAKDDKELRDRLRTRLQQEALLYAEAKLREIERICKDSIDYCRNNNYNVSKTTERVLAEAQDALRNGERLKQKYRGEVYSSLPAHKLTDF